MKKSEVNAKLRKMNRKAISTRVDELRVEIAKKHIEVATGKEKASSKLRELKKELARALTIYPTIKEDAEGTKKKKSQVKKDSKKVKETKK